MNTDRRNPRHRLAATLLVLGLLVLLAACGDDDSNDGLDVGADDVSGDSDASDDAGSSSDDAAGGSAESDVTVTVDGQEYVMSIVQTCTTEGDERSDLAMYGYAETGERVELTFSQQDAESSPTGAKAYFGSVGISSGQVHGQVTSEEPFDFLAGDRSSASGAVTMESTVRDAPGPIDVSFDITCP